MLLTLTHLSYAKITINIELNHWYWYYAIITTRPCSITNCNTISFVCMDHKWVNLGKVTVSQSVSRSVGQVSRSERKRKLLINKCSHLLSFRFPQNGNYHPSSQKCSPLLLHYNTWSIFKKVRCKRFP